MHIQASKQFMIFIIYIYIYLVGRKVKCLMYVKFRLVFFGQLPLFIFFFIRFYYYCYIDFANMAIYFLNVC